MFLLVPVHPGNPGQSPEGHKTDVCVCFRGLGPTGTNCRKEGRLSENNGY